MKKYFVQLDFDFVETFVRENKEKLNIANDWCVVKRAEGWLVIFNATKDNQDVLCLSDYRASNHKDKEMTAIGSRLWQIALYKQFGKPYLKDLKCFEQAVIKRVAKMKMGVLDETLKKIENEAKEK